LDRKVVGLQGDQDFDALDFRTKLLEDSLSAKRLHGNGIVLWQSDVEP
jgi:hypothetical protein